MAQLVEHIVHIDGVTGSSPVATTTIPGRKAWGFFILPPSRPRAIIQRESGSLRKKEGFRQIAFHRRARRDVKGTVVKEVVTTVTQRSLA